MKIMVQGQELHLGGPRGPAGPDGSPIGTVLPFMGTSAPEDYLVCDGAEIPLAAYPALADFFREQFGSANRFGGDGETTFAVPDLRNMFLRGYHGDAEEQLSGEIGERQEATNHAGGFSGTRMGGQFSVWGERIDGNGISNSPTNTDTAVPATYNAYIDFTNQTEVKPPVGGNVFSYTSRPLNTAVLYIIKAKESGAAASESYSTEEQLIGTWIDGKPLYRRSYRVTTPNAPSGVVVQVMPEEFYVVNIYGMLIDDFNSHVVIPGSYVNDHICGYTNGKNIFLDATPLYYNHPAILTIEYTKPTD